MPTPRDRLVPGRTFPDLELPDHSGNPRRLSELAAGDPVVLNFFRGWAPYDDLSVVRKASRESAGRDARTTDSGHVRRPR